MGILQHSTANLLTSLPPQHLLLPAPRIAGYLPVPTTAAAAPMPRKVVSATIANPLRLIDNPREKWAEFERIYGRDRSREEMDAELDAIIPGYTAYMRTKMQQIKQRLSELQAVKEMEAAS